MKKIRNSIYSILLTIICLTATIQPVTADVWPSAPGVAAAAAIVMDVDTGAILYEKNIHDRHYPASITKVMTTLLALETCPLSDIVTFSKESVYNVEGTQVGITPGENVPMDQCLYGVMLGSANEISYAVAEHIGGGSLDTFIQMMNEKATALGCLNTHFNNPHGLPDDNHYTSAYDMALISQAAYLNETFRTITKTRYYIMSPTNLYGEERWVNNHHKMITNSVYHYDFCTGGKTGYTSVAKNTLVTFAEKDNMRLVCVIMKDEETYSQYTDTRVLFDYCFTNFHKETLSEDQLGIHLDSDGLFPIDNVPFTENHSSIKLAQEISVVIPNAVPATSVATQISYDTKENNEIAVINCMCNEHLVGSVSLLYEKRAVTEKAPADTNTATDNKNDSNDFFKINLRIILYVILGIIGIALLAGLIVILSRNLHFSSPIEPPLRRFRRRRRRMRRRRRNTPNDFSSFWQDKL